MTKLLAGKTVSENRSLGFGFSVRPKFLMLIILERKGVFQNSLGTKTKPQFPFFILWQYSSKIYLYREKETSESS